MNVQNDHVPGRDAGDHVDRIAAQWGVERPDLDVSPMHLIGRLHRLGERLHGELRAVFAEFGLSDGEFDVLAALRRSGAPYSLGAGEVARTTMVTAGAVSKRLDRLESAGLVVRAVSASDARSRQVHLTEAGVALVDRAFEAHVANEHRLVAGLTATERSDLVHLLRRWGSALD